MDVGKVSTWHTMDLVVFQAELAYLWANIYALAAGDAGDVMLNALINEDEPTINISRATGKHTRASDRTADAQEELRAKKEKQHYLRQLRDNNYFMRRCDNLKKGSWLLVHQLRGALLMLFPPL